MRLDILETLNSVMGGPLIRQLSSSLGESEENTHTAVRSVGPTMLAALMQKVATPAGATNALRAVEDERIDSGITGKLAGMLGNRGSMDSMSTLGQSLSSSVLGDRSNAVTNALSSVSGVKQGSAMRLVTLGLPLLFGILKKYVTQNRVDASGLSSLVLGQRSSLEKTGLDSRITSALGFSSLSSLLGSLPAGSTAEAASTNRAATTTTHEHQTHEHKKKDKAWLPWAIAAGVAALALVIWSNRSMNERVIETATTLPAAAPEAVSVQVYFDGDETQLSNDDRVKIASIAETVKTQDRPVTITGYSDRVGDEAQSIEVAKHRADAVREALVAEGITEKMIVMDPPTVVSGAGTDEEARRVDIKAR